MLAAESGNNFKRVMSLSAGLSEPHAVQRILSVPLLRTEATHRRRQEVGPGPHAADDGGQRERYQPDTDAVAAPAKKLSIGLARVWTIAAPGAKKSATAPVRMRYRSI